MIRMSSRHARTESRFTLTTLPYAQGIAAGTASTSQTPLPDRKNVQPSALMPRRSRRGRRAGRAGSPRGRRLDVGREVDVVLGRIFLRPSRRIGATLPAPVPWYRTAGGSAASSSRSTATLCPCWARSRVPDSSKANRRLSLRATTSSASRGRWGAPGRRRRRAGRPRPPSRPGCRVRPIFWGWWRRCLLRNLLTFDQAGVVHRRSPSVISRFAIDGAPPADVRAVNTRRGKTR